jgi:addiction module HigA family antidote
MVKNNMRPIHPGEILREEYLEPLGMTSNALSIHLRVPAPRINDVVREKRGITTDTALRLARYFNTTAQYWLNLQTSYELRQAEREVGSIIEKEIQPLAA